MNKYLDIAPEVAEALAAGKPVVALESTIISHGMPYPQNVETALKVEQIIRECGAVPATIAIIGGRLKAGLSKEEIDYLGKTGAGIPKASRRDLPVLVAQGKDGACTVTTTMMIADMAGIRVFATGGIGGALVATIGLVTPSVIVILIVAAFLKAFRDSKWVSAAFYGLRPASTALVAAAGISVVPIALLHSGMTGFAALNWPAIALAAVLLVCTNWVPVVKKWHPIVFIGISALVGVLLKF